MKPSYIAITPARDEESYLPGLVASMTAQTVAPKRWLIIDDGSVDRTGAIIDAAAREYQWIEARHMGRGGVRAPGGESVLNRFLVPDFWRTADIVFRLDADISFERDFAELLLEEFERDPHLGIASGTLYEPAGGQWREVVAPRFHTRGATKIYSRAYLDAAGSPCSGLGWDTIDEVKAAMLGFHTRSFAAIKARHHRPQGAAHGALHARLASGRAAYQAGYCPLFMAARACGHLLGRPPVVGAMAMIAGFGEGYLRRQPRAASAEVIRFVRREQRRRLFLMASLWS